MSRKRKQNPPSRESLLRRLREVEKTVRFGADGIKFSASDRRAFHLTLIELLAQRERLHKPTAEDLRAVGAWLKRWNDPDGPLMVALGRDMDKKLAELMARPEQWLN